MKVATNVPDKGEELAMRRLINVCKIVKKIYPPGMKVWIVSDGHVFSDCIGVNDEVVDNYGIQLRKLYESITDGDHISFCSLPQLFTSNLHAFEENYTEDVILSHYLGTNIDPQSETCRKILMSGCSTDPSILRSLIDNSDPAKLSLYRGFAKFMQEDLAFHPVTMKSSRKACKKIASKVAFEMIKVISNALKEGDYIGGWFKANKKGGHFNVMPLPKDGDKIFESISPKNTGIDSLGLSVEQSDSKPAKMPLVYGIFAPPNFRIDQVTEVLKMLSLVKKKHGNISIEMIALDTDTPSHVGGPSLHSLEDCPDLDVFIVPGVRRVQELTREQLDKVAKICKKTDHVFGIETGTLVLAESGILAGKSACCQSSTNLVSKYPSVDWDHSSESVWKNDEGVWTSSSSFGTTTAFVMFIEKMYPKGEVDASLETTE
ncbi:hypothetical protein D0Z00_001290 [Geotrichum galactomycetum]|uniref:Uncharacterized protein n=1 Tax=Geotrichum galactomycetum TaxID=27317 RepID=A0ACB6V7B7_9ASCO|nr:hypothetical protein D0Z00_001290 [Geotrichum candidum]